MRRASRLRMVRRSRVLVSSPRIWKPRLVFWLGALAIGAISAGFASVADQAQLLFTDVIHADGGRRYLPLLITPLGFVLCAWLGDRYFPGSQGSGIPQCIAARHIRDDVERGGYLSLHVVFGKILLTVVGLGCGASIGREGPTVQVGAALMLQAAKFGGMMRARGLILAGSAAGIAAAFNTPLAGVVFAIEEMSRSYSSRTNGIVLATVIIAGLASLSLVGNYTYFGVTNATAGFPTDWILVVACGVTGGAFGAFFSDSVLRLTRRIRRWRSIQPRWRVVVVAAIAGLVVAIIGVGTGGITYGTGYAQARSAIEGSHLPITFFFTKFVATLASTCSGIPGGLFAPSLAVGAGLGSVFGMLFASNASIAALLGMTGYFAGVTEAPMTSFVIIVEMTGNQANLVPVMTAAVLGYGTARLVSPEPLYHALSRFYIADALRKRRAADSARKREEATPAAAS
ncbi:chloride channel protein [Pararhizobium mangrovi]|uniref:Chloride channel protein n=1 Tax=Pararhizobium mangrovi TaxID=2590452 RepID=A0A506UAD1_9HYPH|nr:chloride channel protein [Pararhizobium mangrovi]TPW29549.1 chloride channel protein [Pararhizobium mangrovi]